MRKLKDTDYLYISTRLKVLEKNLLTKDKLFRLASAKSVSDALKLLCELGWTDSYDITFERIDDILAQKKSSVLNLLYAYCPDRRLIDIFRLKYDYHNVKVFVKSQALGDFSEDLYSNDGVVPFKTLIAALRDKKSADLPKRLYETALDAEDVLLRTKDPQLADILIDKGHFMHMRETADELSGEFLNGYIYLFADLCNLRVAVRSLASDKDRTFKQNAFLPGGRVNTSTLINDNSEENIRKLFGGTLPAEVLDAALSSLHSDGDTLSFDKEFDNALIRYVDMSKLIPFGEAQVISYLIKTENEQTNIKTVLTLKSIGTDADKIMERLILQ